MIHGEPSLTPAVRRRAPTKEILVEWLVKAWNAIPSAMIQHRFKKCGISNNLDGTKDDVIFEDVCPMRAPTVGDSDDSDSDTDMWDDAAVPVPAAFFDTDDSDFEGF